MSHKTLFDKIWDTHVVSSIPGGPDVLYIDRQLIHEVTSPQAFALLREKAIPVFRPQQIVAVADHNVPTRNRHLPVSDPISAHQLKTLEDNCRLHNITCYGLDHPWQGIVHVMAPELGYTLPGMTIVCGDSHTCTHGAFGAIAFGIGTSEVGHVMATQCLIQKKPRQMRIQVDGKLKKNVRAKDIILYILSQLGTSAGNEHFIEFSGETIKALTMEERMTLCNMSIEMGARGGLIAPDETTFAYLQNRTFSPDGEKREHLSRWWKSLHTDDEAAFDKEYHFRAEDIPVMLTYGTNPGMAIGIDNDIPVPTTESEAKAVQYMKVRTGHALTGTVIHHVFIGSCTNSRIEDLRDAAELVQGKKVASHVKAFVVPGSGQVKEQAIKEGIAEILIEAGFDFRDAGCSACLAMNEDKIPAGELCVSTSNRNFEGRQGPGSRTILASPRTAAACAIAGYIIDPEKIQDHEQIQHTAFSRHAAVEG